MPTLTDGREVDSSSEDWRLECLARHRHVETLQSLAGREARAAYVERVRHAEGDEAAARVKASFLVAWQARQS
jgi:hypothetical protein